jgi:hypothetical protein
VKGYQRERERENDRQPKKDLMQNNESDILKEWKATKGRETQRIKEKHRERERERRETKRQVDREKQ